MTRAIALALLLTSAGLAGCLGETNPSTETNETTTCNEGEIHQSKNGRISPAASMTLEGAVTGEPASGEISIASEGTGGFTVVLDRDGEEVWSEEFDAAGNPGGNYHPNPLSAGNYTLTASSEAGTYDLELALTITWSEGC